MKRQETTPKAKTAVLRERVYVPVEFVTDEMYQAWTYLVPDPDPEDPEDKIEIQLWREHNGGRVISFARGDIGKVKKFFGRKAGFKIKDRRVAPPMEHPLTMTTELYTPETDAQGRNQQEVAATWLKYGYGQIKAPARMGKTVVTTDIVCSLGKKTLILSHLWDILDQFERTIREHTDVEDVEKMSGRKLVGRLDKVGWDKIEELDIVLSSWQSWWHPSKRHYLKKYRDTFGAVFVDECFHPEHEMYTGKGWKKVGDVLKTDNVLSFCAETSTAQMEKVTRVVSNNFKGSMLELKGRYFHTLTTPGHEQPIKRKTSAGWLLKRARVEDLLPHSRIQFPIAACIAGHSVDLSVMDKLRIAYEADGHLFRQNLNGDFVYRFAFRRPRKIQALTKILSLLGIAFKKSVNGRGDTNIVFKLQEKMEKSLCWFDPLVSKTKNNQFLYELSIWDGWKCSDGAGSGWQSRNQLDVELVKLTAFLCGKHANSNTVLLNSGNSRDRVHWNKEKYWSQADTITKKAVPYSGPVHCVTVNSGNVITRFKGQISISGNCHLSQAECYAKVVGAFNAKYRCGNSATPYKLDEKHVIIENILGPVVVEGHSRQMKCSVEYVHTDYTVEKFSAWTGMIAALVKSEERNALIVNEAVRDAEAGRYVLITTERTKHAKALSDAINDRGITAIHVVGSTTERDKLWGRARNGDVRVVVAMRRITRLGIDVPLWDCFYNILPTSNPHNYYQEFSRIRTHYDGKPEPIIKDFIDDVENEARGAIIGTMTKRNAVYLEQGFDIKNAAFRPKKVQRLNWGRRTRKSE